ncbi:MAG: hypothetical protein HFI37_04670 [Lachnospiraceae bacterium]|nr:hypothetical protein [Lachnospiraceae bacterium]
MIKYRLENYEETLNHQVIHMDQAVCYCPEFRATRMMHHYPSRRLQLARAVWKDELPISDYIGEINFAGILSRQGERWQNFGECAEDGTDATILCRQMLLEKGYDAPQVKEFKKALEIHANHLSDSIAWKLPMDQVSDMAILLDDETAHCGKESEKNLNVYLKAHKIAFSNEAKSEYLGFEYFAYGLVEEGAAHLKRLIQKYEDLGAKKVMVLSAKAAYLLTKFAEKLDMKTAFEVIYLPEILEPIREKEKMYVYAGSFNLRYLLNGNLLNQLIPGDSEEQIPNSQEFIPLLKGDARVNELTIWQKPIGAEYCLFAKNQKMEQAVREDACADIQKSKAEKILVFEPTAYQTLKNIFKDKKVVYYLEEMK